MTQAIFPGTFDPLTRGHEDLILRAHRLFGPLTVAIAKAHHKTCIFSLSERVALAQMIFQDFPGIQVMPFDGLLVDLARQLNSNLIVRGIRNTSDFEYERSIANVQKTLLKPLETVFLSASPSLAAIESRFVRELAELGADLSFFVSPPIEHALLLKFER